ncbi:MAG: hypothetical protein Q9M39_03840 [Sulfurovum sp.]|nr:hypothetical protein [Sulfurovum sp.]
MSEQVLDEWQISFLQKKEELEKCQISYQVNSCLKCEKLLDCTVRDAYIKALYDSMSKGAGGGFEF